MNKSTIYEFEFSDLNCLYDELCEEIKNTKITLADINKSLL